jgi:cytochrome b561
MTGISSRYRLSQRVLHWLTALLVLATIPAGLTMVQEGLARPTQDALFVFHKNAGVIIFLLVVARIVYRIANPAPPLPASVPRWQKGASHAVHGLLYVLLLVMAISGYIRVNAGGFPLEGLDALGAPRFVPRSDELAETAKSIHAVVKFPLIVLIQLHILAALYHAIVRRDGVFSRMWFGRSAA